MKRIVTCGLAVFMLVLGVGYANAQSPSHAGVAFKVSTLGFGFDVAVPVHQRVNVRGGFNFFTLNHDFDNDGISLAAKLKLRSFQTHLDWFPFAGGFHVSPGVMLYNGNEVIATATVPGGRKFSLGDEDLVSNAADPVGGHSEIKFPKVAPNLLLGWGNIVPRGDRRWSIPVELGVVFTRQPTATITLSGSACRPNGSNCRSIASDAGLQNDVKTEQDQMNDDLSPLKIHPVISFGFSYKF